MQNGLSQSHYNELHVHPDYIVSLVNFGRNSHYVLDFMKSDELSRHFG